MIKSKSGKMPVSRWTISVQTMALVYSNVMARLNGWDDSSSKHGQYLYELQENISNAVTAGELRVRSRTTNMYIAPSFEAYKDGILDLSDFCQWAKETGLDAPDNAAALAVALGMPLEAVPPSKAFEPPAPATEPGTIIAPPTVPPSGVLSGETQDAGLSKREKQIRVIESAIASLSLPAMSIPTGEKKNVEAKCKQISRLFGAGPDPFKEAWQEAVNQNRVRTQNHRQYSGK